MSGPFIYSRRRFLQQAGAFSALSLAGSMDKLGLSGAAAQAPGYKALVCVFLFGGNDANNMVMPFTDYVQYNTARPPSTGLNIPQLGAGAMLKISPTNTGGKEYGLHPNMPELRLLFQGNPSAVPPVPPAAAVVCNMGPLIDPVTRAQYVASGHDGKKVPLNLFSHSDQQQQFMSSISKSTLGALTGWGGRLADKVVGMNGANATPMSMSFSGLQTFGNGVAVKTLALPSSLAFGFTGDGGNAQQVARKNARNAIMKTWDANQMIASAQQTMGVAIDSSALINAISLLQTDPTKPLYDPKIALINTAFTGVNSSLANQLKAVAKVISQSATLFHQREIFFVSIGGFDTHGNQVSSHATLYPQVSKAINAFYQATVALGIANQVTTFTMSDFSRTMQPNGSGTDHAWATHNFVVGGSVLGNKFYGTQTFRALFTPTCTWGTWESTIRAARVAGFRGHRSNNTARRSPVGLARFPPTSVRSSRNSPCSKPRIRRWRRTSGSSRNRIPSAQTRKPPGLSSLGAFFIWNAYGGEVLAEGNSTTRTTPGSHGRSVTPGSAPACLISVVSWPRWCVLWLNMCIAATARGISRVLPSTRLTYTSAPASHSGVTLPAHSSIRRSVSSRSQRRSAKSAYMSAPKAGTMHGSPVKRPSHIRSPHRRWLAVPCIEPKNAPRSRLRSMSSNSASTAKSRSFIQRP